MVQKVLAAALAVSVIAFCCPLAAAGDGDCSSVSRQSVVRCALAASLDGRAERQSVEALEGRRAAVSLLPANPVLSLAASRRTAGGAAATNWTASLAQELEIGGQRGTRRAAVDAEITARKSGVAAVDRDVAARAWRAYFEALAARDELALTTRLEKTLERVNLATRAAANRGLASGVESDLADIAALRVTQARGRATVRARTASVALASLIGFDVTTASPPPLEGELVPLASAERVSSSTGLPDGAARPEVQTAEFERRAFELRASAYRRSRIPNVTVSAFVENDGFNERVIGAGIALPIPLPSPLGRTYAGEIAENEALARRAATEVGRVRRAIRLEWMTALQAYDGAKTQAAAFTTERLGRADQGLASIAAEIEAGRLSIRDAVVSQQALVDLLLSAVQARFELCLSSVDLVYAAGLPLTGSGE